MSKYAKRPRVSRQNSAATMRDISAWYRDEWRKKVERIGNLNYWTKHAVNRFTACACWLLSQP